MPDISLPDAGGLLSPAMISVYASVVTLIGLAVKMVYDLFTAKQRRAWEVEDRDYKDALALKTEQTVQAANLANTQIKRSMEQRSDQIDKVLTAVQENTVLTQESKDASKEALDVANGHNDKILKATELATAALGAVTTRLQ
jgi:hypothetical protein